MNKEGVAVIGAGVIGLTTALEAQKAGYDVTIYAEKPPLETTSAKAGAVFEPYQPGDMSTEDMLSFVRTGLRRYGEIIDANAEARTGIRSHDLYSTSTDEINPADVAFLPAIPNWQLVGEDEAPGDYKSALILPGVPFIDPTKALPWLTDQFVNKNGGTIRAPHRKIVDLDEFVSGTPETIVFNCSGLGAKDLLNDEEIRPVRGQIAIIGYTPDWDHSILGNDGYYIFPRMEETVLGGTVEPNEWEEVPDDATIERIIERARVIMPDIRTSDITRTYAGLRPYRDSGAKISRDQVAGKTHIQNVGFGGSGWTFAWGAAEKAVSLLDQNVALEEEEKRHSLEPSLQTN